MTRDYFKNSFLFSWADVLYVIFIDELYAQNVSTIHQMGSTIYNEWTTFGSQDEPNV